MHRTFYPLLTVFFLSLLPPAAVHAQYSQILISPTGWNAGETRELKAPWDFYWDRLIEPEEFGGDPVLDGLLPDRKLVPGFWNYDGYPVFGKATARIVCKSATSFPDAMGLGFYSIYSAYRLYVNGQLVAEMGTLGDSPAAETGRAPRTTVYFTTNGAKTLDIVLQMSNHSYTNLGGIGGPPVLGSQQILEQKKYHENLVDFLLAGSLGFMGLYLITLFFFRRKDRSPLFLGLFALSLVLRQLMISGGKSIFHILPFMDVVLWDYLQTLAIFPLLPLLVLYVVNLFPGPGRRIPVLLFCIESALLMILYYMPFSPAVQDVFASIRDVSMLLGLLYVLYVCLDALRRKQSESGLVASGMVMVIVFGVNDILHSMNVINTNYYITFGVWFFLLFQSIILARRFSRAFQSVEDLSRSLEEKTLTLLELDVLKDEFLANTTHELKTPLNGIIGITESLSSGDLGDLSSEQKRQLNLVATSGRRLFTMVNDILDFSKIRKNKMRIYPAELDFLEVVQPICEVFSGETVKRGLFLENHVASGLPHLMADPARLEQILYNLLGNALKFTAKGGITLSAGTDGSFFWFCVEDTGIGIPQEKQELIFESFQQGDGSISRKFGGTGLGLSITKNLVEIQQGIITVASKEGEGSRFTVYLPLASTAAAEPVTPLYEESGAGEGKDLEVLHEIGSPAEITAPELPSVPKGDESNPLVFIVDDEPINLQVLQNFLAGSQYRVAVAGDGKTAIRLVREGLNPDILLLDIMMPGISGYEVLEDLRKSYLPVELPVLLLTAKNQTHDIVTGFALGANDYLTKPFSREELLARIRAHIGLKKINKAYNCFVPREFINLLGKESLLDLRLGTQIQRDMTVLFSDIRSFAAFSENMTPGESFSFINSYLSRFGPIIRQHGGFVDKYIGDGIMALFPGKPADALRAAAEMRYQLGVYNEHLVETGYVPIEFGIGIHTGSVVMGTVGEAQRMDTTVMSDVVNLSSRLETLTKLLKTKVLVTNNCLENFTDIPSRYVGKVKVKGKKLLVDVSELLFEDEKIQSLPLFVRGMQAYESRDFAAASEAFRAVLDLNKYDFIAELYRKKSEDSLVDPPHNDTLQFIDMEHI